MAAAAVPLMIAGSAVSAMGHIQQGKAAKAAADFNANIERQNAEIAREQAMAEAKQFDREQFLREGAVRAAAGASGGKQTGSVLDVLADLATQGEIQRQDILYRGELAARGHTNTAALEQASGKNAKRSSYLAAGSELLSGGGKIASLKRA